MCQAELEILEMAFEDYQCCEMMEFEESSDEVESSDWESEPVAEEPVGEVVEAIWVDAEWEEEVRRQIEYEEWKEDDGGAAKRPRL